MKKLKTEKEEIYALLDDVFHLINRFTGDFAKYCSNKGCIKLSKESIRFIVTIKLERKKEAK